MSTHFTQLGVPGIAPVPYGIHVCQFYETRADLAAALVPYFSAGLQAGERCIWITAPPLGAADAAAALRERGLDVAAALAKGGLVIREHSDWYSNAQGLKGTDVLELWLEEERRALAAGYTGLRITGNTSFLTPADWATFMEYESLIDRALSARRIVTLCTYRLGQLRASEIHDVAQRHAGTLHAPDGNWQLQPRR